MDPSGEDADPYPLTVMVEPCGALPRKCLFICFILFYGKDAGCEYIIIIQCDISAPKLRAEEHVGATPLGHDRRDDRAIFAGETIRYERVGFIEFQPGIEDDGIIPSFTPM
jgi:hypothetical protein